MQIHGLNLFQWERVGEMIVESEKMTSHSVLITCNGNIRQNSSLFLFLFLFLYDYPVNF